MKSVRLSALYHPYFSSLNSIRNQITKLLAGLLHIISLYKQPQPSKMLFSLPTVVLPVGLANAALLSRQVNPTNSSLPIGFYVCTGAGWVQDCIDLRTNPNICSKCIMTHRHLIRH